MLPRTWYRDFFHGLALDVWREGVPPEQTAAELRFLERTLALPRGARILDVPCGAGRHAIPLAERGFEVTGVDLSEEHLDQGRRRAEAATVDIEWRHSEMRDLPWEAHFDAGLCLGNSFGYVDREGTQAYLRAMGRALKAGARFILDTGMAAESILPGLEDRQETTIGDIRFVEQNLYHAEVSCLETRYTFERSGRVETGAALHWIFTVAHIRELLDEAGFTTDAIHGSFDEEPFVLGSPQLVLAATRR
jgi:SAM-dependent methyltransferase